MSSRTPSFGGNWTEQKLAILENYLNAYSTALKRKSFRLMYIDAFAGTGVVELSLQHYDDDGYDDELRGFIRGSALRAIQVMDKPFDRLIFVERDSDRCQELEELKRASQERDICIVNSDANRYLTSAQEDWKHWRGVLFLDPFATAVEWSTLEVIASFNALDTWILFPVSAVARMLPRSRLPDDISQRNAERLTSIYGDESWRGLYDESPQEDLFRGVEYVREPGVDGLVRIYKANLKKLFGDRLLDNSKTLFNSKNSPLFEFMFCVGNPNGIRIAKPIAEHLLEGL